MKKWMSAATLLVAIFVWAAPALAQPAKNVIRSDFLVNADTTSRDDWRYAKSSADRYGNFVVVWVDDCNGDDDIYARVYDADGNAVGSSFRVNDDASNLKQSNPCVAMNESGKFVIAWQDARDLLDNIYFQRYNSYGSALGGNQLGNEDQWDLTQRKPSAAMDGNGGFVLAWEDERDISFGIYARRFDSTGTALGGDFQVDDNDETQDLSCPVVGMSRNGRFVVAWQDYRAGNMNVYAKVYDSTGVQQGANFQVNTEVLSHQASPSIGMNGDGAFVIAWEDNQHLTHWDIFARRYNSAGASQGDGFQVSAETGSNNSKSSVGMDSLGNFTIAWWKGHIYARRYNSSGTALGAEFEVGQYGASDNVSNPTVAMGGKGSFQVVYERGYENYHINVQQYDSSGTAQGLAFQVDDNMGHSHQICPAVAMDRSGRFAVAWSDSSSAFREAKMYFQQYDAAGDPVGLNVLPFKASTDQSYPAVAAGGGVTTVFWSQSRINGYRVMARRYDDNGTPLDTVLFVGDTIPVYHKKKPAVAAGGNGRVAAAWDDARDYTASDTFNVYFQLIDSNGTLLGVNQKVNDDATLKHQLNPAMAASHAGNFFVVWQDDRSGNYDIYAQRYDPSGMALGANFKVNDDAGSMPQQMPSVACDSAGNVVVAWQDRRLGGNNIYAQRYDPTGTAIGANFMVNDDGSSAYKWNPAVACAPTANRFVICWTDYRNGDGDPEIMAQSYQGGVASGANFQVTDDDNFPYHHQTTSRWNVAANDDRVAFAWTDNRRHKGYDVYARLTDWGFNTIVAQLPTPVLLAPADGAWQTNGTFHCSWSASKKKDAPVYYLVKAYQLPDTINPVLVDTTSLTADTLVLGTEARYAWRVEARDDGGSLPGISGLWRLGYDQTPPANIAQIGPADSLATKQSSITFCWHPSSDAVSGIREYALIYAYDEGFTSGLAETTLTDTSITLALADTNYCWMVEARDTVGNVGVSYVWHLNVDTQDPAVPALTLPAAGAWQQSDTVVCVWSEVARKASPAAKASEVSYVIQLDTNSSFSSPVIEDTTGFLSDTLALSEGIYHWRVMAYDAAGNYGGYSASRSFGIDHTPPDIQYLEALPDDDQAPYGPYPVGAKAYDLSGVNAAWLYFRTNLEAWDSTAMSAASDSLYASIPALSPAANETLTVSYYVKATDLLGLTQTSSILSFKVTGPTGAAGGPEALPKTFALQPAYPNPSRGQTTFSYQLPKAAPVALTVYDLTGREVKRYDQGTLPAGHHQILWQAPKTLANGVYFYRLTAGSFTAIRKLLVVR